MEALSALQQKKEAMAKRKAERAGREMQLHGRGQGLETTSSGAAQKLADVPITVPEHTARILADVPITVPELPGALLIRSELIEQIKSELLNETGSSTAALTSKKAKHKSSVHGMGGVGEAPFVRCACACACA